MRWRVVGAVAVLAVVGVAAGYGVGRLDEPEPRSFTTPAPLPAISPAVPTVAPPDVQPDPTYPPLGVDLPDHRVKLPTGRGYPLTLRVPDGWIRYRPDPKAAKWTWVGPDQVENTFLMRVEIEAGETFSPGGQLGGRLAALQEAESNEGISDLRVDQQSSDAAVATLGASYLDSGGYRRVTLERWVAFASTFAYVTVAVTGRESDRDGMESLLDRVSASLEPS